MRSRNQSNSGMTATKMRVVLSACLLLIILAMATGFYFSYLYLKDVSSEVSAIQAEASSSDANIQALMNTEKLLKKHADTVAKAGQIVAESQSYQYQDQVVTDLSEYARRAGVPISSISFQGAGGDGSAAAPATPEAGTEPAKSPAAGKTTTVSVQLASDINYPNLLHFVHLIEENLTRMQIAQLSLSRGSSDNTVSAQTLSIEVYLK